MNCAFIAGNFADMSGISGFMSEDRVRGNLALKLLETLGHATGLEQAAMRGMTVLLQNTVFCRFLFRSPMAKYNIAAYTA
jgi:hypothetical protein